MAIHYSYPFPLSKGGDPLELNSQDLYPSSEREIRHLQMALKTPCLPPRTLQNLCLSFLLGITVVLREMKNNAYPKF